LVDLPAALAACAGGLRTLQSLRTSRTDPMQIRRTPLPAILLTIWACAAHAACPPADWDSAGLQRLRGAKFEGLEAVPRQALARSFRARSLLFVPVSSPPGAT